MNDGICAGLLELDGRRGGHLRKLSIELDRQPGDPYVSPSTISRFVLRNACFVEGTTKRAEQGKPEVAGIRKVNGLEPDEWKYVEEFSSRTAVDPSERIRLSAV